MKKVLTLLLLFAAYAQAQQPCSVTCTDPQGCVPVGCTAGRAQTVAPIAKPPYSSPGADAVPQRPDHLCDGGCMMSETEVHKLPTLEEYLARQQQQLDSMAAQVAKLQNDVKSLNARLSALIDLLLSDAKSDNEKPEPERCFGQGGEESGETVPCQ